MITQLINSIRKMNWLIPILLILTISSSIAILYDTSDVSIENTTSKTMRWDPSEKYVTTISSFQNLIYFDELGNTDREIEIFLDQDDKVNLINYIWIENNSKLLIFGNFQYNYSSVMAILDYPSMQPASYHILNSREGRIDAIAYSSANSIVAFAMAYYEDPSNNYIYTLNTY
ncbi:MAG: hypothetical protein OEZ01_08175 [Candidatus Heimdallarchaeota archaeon]|nr:hypothetical protein [Candidatus Heimdallarchaeota archaeon]